MPSTRLEPPYSFFRRLLLARVQLPGYIKKYAGSGTRTNSFFPKATASTHLTVWTAPTDSKVGTVWSTHPSLKAGSWLALRLGNLMGQVKRLKLWWQLYVTWLPVRDLENFRPMDFCSSECTNKVVCLLSWRLQCTEEPSTHTYQEPTKKIQSSYPTSFKHWF